MNSRAGQLSGGNKRKLSVAMATIGEPPMVFLDEPSAGMDPVARRGMWSVIKDIADQRQKSVVILTTHSMEEAEALCSRIAIQVDGQFRCLGTAQQIKSLYGQGLELNVRLATPTPQEIAECSKKLGADDSFDSPTARARVAAAFGEAMAVELAQRQGSPIGPWEGMVTMASLAEWTLLHNMGKKFEEWLAMALLQGSPGLMPSEPTLLALERGQNVCRYQILSAALQGRFVSLGGLFELLQSQKEAMRVDDFQICQTSLEQVFNRFALSQTAVQQQQQMAQQQMALQQQQQTSLLQQQLQQPVTTVTVVTKQPTVTSTEATTIGKESA